MTTPTFEEATTPAEQAYIASTLLDLMAQQGADGAGFPDTSPQMTLVQGDAALLALLSETTSALANTASPRRAKRAGSSWVDASAEWYDIEREPAVKAVWDIPVKSIGGPITIEAGSRKIVFQSDASGSMFENTNAAALTIAAGGTGTLRMSCRVAGVVGNVPPGSIVYVMSAPADLAIDTNGTQTLVTSGANAEGDDPLVDRGIGRWGTIGRAWNREAFNYWIPTSAPSVNRWRVRDNNPDGPGTVRVLLANASGPATLGEISAVNAKLQAIKAIGSSTLTVVAATTHALSITVTLDATAAAKTAAQAALEALGAAFPIGPTTLTVDLVRAVLMGGAFNPDTNPIVIDVDGSDEELSLTLAGFSGVTSITSLSLSSDEALADGELLGLTVTVS